jgi:hypothetical protein
VSVFETRARVAAPPERVWKTMSDVERWGEWTPSITAVERLGAGSGPGARFRVRQPKLLPAVWTVTWWEPGAGFAWESRSPGLRALGEHRLLAVDGATDVVLRVVFSGLLSPLVSRLAGPLTRRYMEMEAAGLKARCEAG